MGKASRGPQKAEARAATADHWGWRWVGIALKASLIASIACLEKNASGGFYGLRLAADGRQFILTTTATFTKPACLLRKGLTPWLAHIGLRKAHFTRSLNNRSSTFSMQGRSDRSSRLRGDCPVLDKKSRPDFSGRLSNSHTVMIRICRQHQDELRWS